MKYQLQILLSVLLCMVGKVDASSLYDYGLSLKSHSVPGIERTTLYLDDNQPFSIKNDFIISFQMQVQRDIQPFFPFDGTVYVDDALIEYQCRKMSFFTCV